MTSPLIEAMARAVRADIEQQASQQGARYFHGTEVTHLSTGMNLDLNKTMQAALTALQESGYAVVSAEPDYCYDPDDWEATFEWSERDVVGDEFKNVMGSPGPFEVACLKKLPSRYVAEVPTELDEDGDVLDSEWRWFDTREEADAALSAAQGGE